MTLLFLVHVGATLAMTGLIWFVQVVHYPLFAAVGEASFSPYEIEHARRTGFVVIPLMLAEACSAVLLAWLRPAGLSPSLLLVGLALVGLIWASTFLVQVPLHEVLARGFDADAHRRLVASNWLRTFLWSARAVLVLWLASTVLTVR